jgi:hypothetical protein
MINEKIKLRYESLLERYGETIGKKEYAIIFGISISTIDKYIAKGGINLVPYKKYETIKYGLNKDKQDKKQNNNSKVYWDTLDIAIGLEKVIKAA